MKAGILVLATVAGLLTVAGCRYIGGGIAGASYDPTWQVRAARLYGEGVASNRLAVTVAPLTGEEPPQLFGGIMHAFPIREEMVGETFVPVAGTGLAARYSKNRFEILRDKVTVISEELPRLFNMHPVRMGMCTLSSQPVIMIVNKSRSSTGLYFVTLYTAAGVPLNHSRERTHSRSLHSSDHSSGKPV
ncbi:MAG: hypothetical protein WCI03_10410 [bacterium]|jgi:hypothetical protein